MARSARVVIAGCPHHVVQRGNNRKNVFFSDDDRRMYITFLRESAERFDLSFAAFCLMPDHVHLVAVPKTPESLALTLKRAHQLYSQYVKRKYPRKRRLWEGRFSSCALDDFHFWTALKYVERNPVRVGLVKRAELYPWCSAKAHGGEGNSTGLPMKAFPKRSIGPDWLEGLSRPEKEEYVQELRACTSRGRPMGSTTFIARLEKLLGLSLRAKPMGRPKKNKDTKKKR